MKLLHYTSYRYILYTALLTFISIPIFYVSLSKIFVDSIDSDLRQQASEIPSFLSAIQSEKDLQLWRTLDNDLQIIHADSTTFMSGPFTVHKAIDTNGESADFRILQKEVDILGQKYIINIEASLIEKEDLIRTILFIQLGILFLLLTGAVFINYFINKKIWKPFYDSLYFLKQFDIEKSVRIEPEKLRIQEFEELNQSIHLLSIRVSKAYFSQKEFIENASHELQTPLTVLKFKLELLLQNTALTPDQGEFITDMYREIEQMQELNSNLLLLSKIENGQFSKGETLDVIDLTQQVIEELSLIADSKSQQIVELYEVGELMLHTSKTLLKILIRNLLINGIKYSEPGSSIEVSVSTERLKITNPGTPMGLPVDRLFERFVRNTQANTARNGSGLGLAIVKNIADYNKYKISYQYEEGKHAFSLYWNQSSKDDFMG